MNDSFIPALWYQCQNVMNNYLTQALFYWCQMLPHTPPNKNTRKRTIQACEIGSLASVVVVSSGHRVETSVNIRTAETIKCTGYIKREVQRVFLSSKVKFSLTTCRVQGHGLHINRCHPSTLTPSKSTVYPHFQQVNKSVHRHECHSPNVYH